MPWWVHQFADRWTMSCQFLLRHILCEVDMMSAVHTKLLVPIWVHREFSSICICDQVDVSLWTPWVAPRTQLHWGSHWEMCSSRSFKKAWCRGDKSLMPIIWNVLFTIISQIDFRWPTGANVLSKSIPSIWVYSSVTSLA